MFVGVTRGEGRGGEFWKVVLSLGQMSSLEERCLPGMAGGYTGGTLDGWRNTML